MPISAVTEVVGEMEVSVTPTAKWSEHECAYHTPRKSLDGVEEERGDAWQSLQTRGRR